MQYPDVVIFLHTTATTIINQVLEKEKLEKMNFHPTEEHLSYEFGSNAGESLRCRDHTFTKSWGL